MRASGIKLVGSTASGYAGPDSDIDLEVDIEGERHDSFTSEYFEKDRILDEIIYVKLSEIRPKRYKREYRIDVHLANNYQNEEYKKLLEGGRNNFDYYR